MASRLAAFRPLVQEMETALKNFQTSNSSFRVLKSLEPSAITPKDPVAPSEDNSPKTLYILDSSFNPPSVAHRYLAQSALRKASSDQYSKPHRLLLLFATMNADKAPSAASFDQRLTLMSIFANDLIQSLKAEPSEYTIVPIDIGVTKVPYYTDKTAAIEAEGTEWYPSKPKHIHIVGYDTLTRLFNTKYYKDYDPPFSALYPYFDNGHEFRVTLRPDEDYGSEEEQQAFVDKLGNGELEKDGGRKLWSQQIQIVPPHDDVGVSSTKIRKAAKREDWDALEELATPTVAAWVRDQKLYEQDDKGAKMA